MASGPSVTSGFSRSVGVVVLVSTGILFSLITSFVGIVLLVGLLDATCCPPLFPLGNFGQFGIFVILAMPVFVLGGVCFGLIPFLRWWIWVISYVFIFALGATGIGLFGVWAPEPHPVVNVAVCLAGLVHCASGIACRGIYAYLERRELSDAWRIDESERTSAERADRIQC